MLPVFEEGIGEGVTAPPIEGVGGEPGDEVASDKAKRTIKNRENKTKNLMRTLSIPEAPNHHHIQFLDRLRK